MSFNMRFRDHKPSVGLWFPPKLFLVCLLTTYWSLAVALPFWSHLRHQLHPPTSLCLCFDLTLSITRVASSRFSFLLFEFSLSSSTHLKLHFLESVVFLSCVTGINVKSISHGCFPFYCPTCAFSPHPLKWAGLTCAITNSSGNQFWSSI